MESGLISYYGYFTPFGGYGIANFNWVKHLMRKGIWVYPHGKFMPKPGTPEWEILNEEERNIANIPFVKQQIGIIESTPYDFDIIDTEIKICNTMGETDRLGKDWVNKINRMDYVLVPNSFQRNMFIESGVKKPVFVIPHGTETEKFPYYERPQRKDFTFLIAGYLNDRKGVFDVIRAFVSEFEENEPVKLILKSSNPSFGYYSNFTDSRITTINRLIDPQGLNELYQIADCFVFPSKAEGIGQPPREAMATGLPVIVGNYSGLEEIALPEISYPLQVDHLEEGINPQNIEQPGNWAIYDIQELMYQMRYVYEHQQEARQKGKVAAKWIRDNFSWESAADEMIAFLNTI